MNKPLGVRPFHFTSSPNRLLSPTVPRCAILEATLGFGGNPLSDNVHSHDAQ